MDYKVLITSDAEADLEGFIRYLLYEKKSEQAASNVLNDFEATKQTLAKMAGSLKLCDTDTLCYIGLKERPQLWIIFFMNCRIMKIK